jgi:hypothetical protein
MSVERYNKSDTWEKLEKEKEKAEAAAVAVAEAGSVFDLNGQHMTPLTGNTQSGSTQLRVGDSHPLFRKFVQHPEVGQDKYLHHQFPQIELSGNTLRKWFAQLPEVGRDKYQLKEEVEADPEAYPAKTLELADPEADPAKTLELDMLEKKADTDQEKMPAATRRCREKQKYFPQAQYHRMKAIAPPSKDKTLELLRRFDHYLQKNATTVKEHFDKYVLQPNSPVIAGIRLINGDRYDSLGGPIISETRLLTAGPFSSPFTVTPYVHLVPAAAAVFSFSTMEKEIFITRPCLPLNDSATALSSSVSCSAGSTQSKLNERHSSMNDGDRVFTQFFRITTMEAAHNELSSSNDYKSGLANGKEQSGTFSRVKRNLIELQSLKNEGERAFASSPYHNITLEEEKIAESPLRPRNDLLTPSLHNVVSNSARRIIGTLNELQSSKNDGERAISSSPHTSPFIMKGKIIYSQHKLPHDKPAPQGHGNAVAAHARCLIVNLNELLSSKFDGEQVFLCPPQCPTCESFLNKGFHDQSRVRPLSEWQHGCHYEEIDGELASASSLSKEFYYYRVSLFPLGECQPGCLGFSKQEIMFAGENWFIRLGWFAVVQTGFKEW